MCSKWIQRRIHSSMLPIPLKCFNTYKLFRPKMGGPALQNIPSTLTPQCKNYSVACNMDIGNSVKHYGNSVKSKNTRFLFQGGSSF